jgi:Ca2+/Na+ antiporter
MNFSKDKKKFKYLRSQFSISNNLFNIKIKELKLDRIVVVVILTFITFIFLIWKGYSIGQSLLPSLIYPCILILYTYFESKIKKESIDSTIGKIGKETKEMEHEGREVEWSDVTSNPYLKNFFKRLEEKGILSLKELEKELIEQSEKVIFIIESGEGTSKFFRSVFKWKKKKEISEKSEDGEERSEIYFSEFMKKEFKKKIGDKIEIYRIPIPGISSFIVFCNENEQKCSNINNLYDIIYKGYSDYIDVEVRKDLNKLKNEGKLKEYEELNKWYEEYKKALNERSRPLIIITMPYRISLFTLLKIISYYYKNKDHNIPKTIEQKINQILDQKIKLKNSGIRFLYLFEAVFDKDEEISKRFEELENRIVEKLKNKYKITKDNDYFYQLLHKKNFIEKFEESLKEINEDFYNEIKNDSRYKDLKRLIIYIQTKIFGVSLQNISI